MPTTVMERTEPAALRHLADAVGTLAAIEPESLDTDTSLTVARAVEQVSRAAEAALIRCVITWHDRGDPVQSPETTEEELTWRATDAARKALMVDLGRSRGEAGRLVATARALRQDRSTSEVLRSGRISAPQARIIAETVGTLARLPAAAADGARQRLIDCAQSRGTDELRRQATDATHRHAPDVVLNKARSSYEKRHLTMTPALGGYVPGGFLPTVGAEAVLTVLDAMADAPSVGEDDGLARARADALVQLAEDRLRARELPSRHGGATAMTVVMRADTALGLPGAPAAVTGYGQSLPAAEAHMLTCEASLRAVLVDGDGEVLWQGRKRRLASRAQYEALEVRDGGCTAPGCRRPPHECDAHHRMPWSRGGRTDVDQMRLLCRRHHREVHDELWLRQSGWQSAEIAALSSGTKLLRPRRPWYVDAPAWYPGPSPWNPDGKPDGGRRRLRAEACRAAARSTEAQVVQSQPQPQRELA